MDQPQQIQHLQQQLLLQQEQNQQQNQQHQVQVAQLQQQNHEQGQLIQQQQQQIHQLEQQQIEDNQVAPEVEEPQGVEQQDAEEGQAAAAAVVAPPVVSDELKKAIEDGDILKIISRLDAGESPNSVDSDGWPATMLAIHCGHLGAAKVFYGWGADLSRADDDGRTLLHMASEKGNLEHINWVLNNATIDVNSADNNGETPVMWAVDEGHIDAVKLLSGRGADLSGTNNGWTLLHFASREGNLEHINWLFDNATIDVNSTNSTGRTPLSIALHNDKLDVAKFLVEKGGDIFMKNNYGERAIDVRVDDKVDGIQLGTEVLEHAKALRRSSIKEFLLLSKACQSSDRRKVAPIMSMDDDVDLEGIQRSARLAASVLGDSGISRMIGSFLLRSDLIIRDKSIPLEADDVKRRVEETISSSSSNSKRARLD
jgi:ankyrin repeat protein